MVRIFCKLCLHPVKATEWKTHIAQKQHLQQLPLKILIKGSYSQEQVKEIYSYFAKFGGIRGLNVTTGEVTTIEYRFWDARVYSEVIHQEHKLFDEDLDISWYKRPKTGSLEYVVQNEEMLNEKYIYRKLAIINAFQKMETFSEQLKMFESQLNNIKIESEKLRVIIQQDLNKALVSHLPNSEIHFYGSSITELQIHNSKFKIFLNNTDSSISTLEQIKDLITKSENFTNIFLIEDLKFPYMITQHKKIKMDCEITIKNEMPIAKSELIKFYLTLDEKLRLFMLMIKFWADCYELRKETAFSSYLIYSLVIFYLQQEPYNLPSVVTLQKDLPCDEIDGWNCAFGPIEFTNSVLETATMMELLIGFFKFYGDLDYISFLISPYFGSLIDKTEFLDSSRLSDRFEDYKKLNIELNFGLCIQDFFQLSSNNCLQLPFSLAAKFSALSRKSFDLLQSEEKDLLNKLFLFVQNTDINEFVLKLDEFVTPETATKLLIRILKEVCYCQVEHQTVDNSEIYSCKGKYNIWDRRFELLKTYRPVSNGTLQREINLTSLVVEHVDQKLSWEMEVTLTFEAELSNANLVFRGNQDFVFHIGHFVYKTLKQCLNDKAETEYQNIDEKVSAEFEDVLDLKSVLKDEEIKIENENLDSPTRLTEKDKNYCETKFDRETTTVLKAAENLGDENNAEQDTVTKSNNGETISVLTVTENLKEANYGESDNELKMNEETRISVEPHTEIEFDTESVKETTVILEVAETLEDENPTDLVTDRETTTILNGSESLQESYTAESGNETKFDTEMTAVENFEYEISRSDLDDTAVLVPVETFEPTVKEIKIEDARIGENTEVLLDSKAGTSTETQEGAISNKIVEYSSGGRETERTPVPVLSPDLCVNSERGTPTDFNSLKLDITSGSKKIINFTNQIIYFINKITAYENDVRPEIQRIHEIMETIIGSENLSGYIFDWDYLRFLACNEIRTDSHQNFLRNKLKKKGFLDVVSYSDSGTVFFECKDGKTNLNCKVCVNNRRSIQNIQVLEYYMDLDDKIRILFNFVQFWAICYDIYPHIDSDAIYILIIFYLQQEPYSLPAISRLQENVEPHIEFDWNRAFTGFNYNPSTLENYSDFDIISGFFKFYEKFDYLTYVITPYTGCPIEKIAFLEPFDLPHCYQDYIRQYKNLDIDAYVCIQDPFEHSAKLRFDFEAESFSYLCRTSLDLMNKGESELLHNLFLHANDCKFVDCYSFFLTRDYTEELQWKCFLRALISTFFEKVLACDVEVLSIKPDDYTYIIKGETKIIENRNQVYKMLKRDFSFDMKELDKEIAITSHIVRYFPITQKYWTMTICVEFLSKPCGVKISNKGVFSRFLEGPLFHFMRVKLGRFLEDNSHGFLTKEEKIEENGLDIFDENGIFEKLQRGTTLLQQLRILYDSLTTPKLEVEKKVELFLKDLNLAFTSAQKIFLFGSKSLHLDFRKDSYDIYIDLANNKSNEVERKLKQTGKFSDFKYFLGCLCCKHVATQVFIRITINNTVLLKTTNVIKYYMSYDRKIPLLMMLVKFCVNHFNLAKDAFTSYTIYLLVIFYLQQKPYYFPPVSKLKDIDLKADANVCFNNCLLNWSIFDLVTGFFTFYGSFDYSKYAICPYVGLSIEKENLLKPYDLPEDYSDYINQDQEISVNSRFCIQDIFDHAQNLSKLIVLDKCGKFATMCRAVLQEVSRNYDLSQIKTLNCDSFKFDIEKNTSGSFEVWRKCVEICTNDVLKQVLCCQNRQASIAAFPAISDPMVTIYHYLKPIQIWDDRIKISKNIDSTIRGIERDALITSEIIKIGKHRGYEDIQVSLIFQPEKVEFSLRGKHDMIHVTHIIYVNLTRLLQLTSLNRTENILEGNIWNFSVDKNNGNFKKQVKTQIPSHATFEDQITSLIKMLSFDQNVLKDHLSQIRKDLVQILPPVNEIIFVGSSVLGVFNQQSCVDICINFKTTQELTHLKELVASSQKFTEVRISEIYNYPGFKCEHKGTKLTCVIFLDLKLGLHQTEVLRYYINVDPKIRSLVIFVRFWADCVGLKHEQFSNYVFTLLVVFYLQQKPYNLPSVSELQEIALPQRIQGYTTNIMPVEVTSLSLQKATLFDLIQGFFEFYSSLDYISYIISPYTGNLIEKITFSDTKMDGFNSQAFIFKIWLCIQDPIELSKNLLADINHTFSGVFTSKCRYSVTLMKTGENHLLSDLLTPEAKMDFFEILSDKKIASVIWERQVIKIFKTAVTKMLKSRLTQDETKHSYTFLVGDFTTQYDIESVRKLSTLVTNLFQWKKDNCLMLNLIANPLKHELQVEIIFNSCPQRVTFYFCNTTSDFFYHYIHIFYIKLLNYLSLKTLENRDRIYSILQEKSLEENVAVLDKKLSCYRSRQERLQNAISNDLFSVLSQNFGGIEIYFYNTSLTGLKNKNLSIYISNVTLQRATFELLMNLITKSGKFANVMLSSDIEISIKCKHIPTQTFCEINVKNPQPFTTTELIKFFKNADQKISLLMLIVKFWADSFNCLLSNDAILLLVVFFLQDQYNFPSVYQLEEEKPWKMKNFQDFFQTIPLFQLLLDFFNYYSNFDSTQHLVSPFHGSIIKKTYFLKPYDLPDSFENYMSQNEELTIRSVLDIQDPFQHSKNLVEEIDPHYLESFAFRCYLAAKNFSNKCDLPTLFDKSAVSVKNVTYELKVKTSNWKSSLITIIAKILRDGFGYETIENSQPVYNFECTGNLYLYHNRAFASKMVLMPSTCNDLDETIAIAKATKAHFNQAVGTVHMNLKLDFKANSCLLEIQHSRKKVTPLLTHLLYVRIMKALKEIEKINITGDVLIEDNLSEKIENQTNAVLNDLQIISTFSVQVTTLQKVFISTEIQIEQNELIQADLRSALSILNLKKISTSSRTSVNENLYIYVEFEEQNQITIQQIRDLINKSEVFGNTSKISQSTTACSHCKSNILCVINTTYKFYEENEKLMQFYLNLDKKISSLIFIVQFWAYRHKLTEICGFSPRAISLIVIFFLQQTCNLPSVAKLQENVAPEIKFGWNSALSLKGNASQRLKESTLLELVCRFFEFYAQFDYISNVISVYSGVVVGKECFLKPYSLPDCYKDYMKQDNALILDSSICIQDCFDHSLNITADVPLYFSGRFATLCRSASKVQILLESTYLYNIMKFDSNLTSFELKKSQYVTFEDLIEFFENSLRKMIACGLQIMLQNSGYRRYIFSGKYNIWNNRIMAMKKLNEPFPNETEKEIALSKYLMHYFPQRLSTKFCVTLLDAEDSYKVEFEFCDFNLCYHISQFIFLNLFKRWKLNTYSSSILEQQNIEIELNPFNSVEAVTNQNSLEVEQKSNLEEETEDNLLTLELSPVEDIREESFEDETLIFYTNFLKEKEQRQKCIKKMHLDLISTFGHRKVYIFGSSATGLDLSTSDVNISVDWNSDESETIQSCTTKAKLNQSDKFENVSITSGAKLTCQHAKTKLHVTIDSSGEIGIHQTEFIKYYLSLDEKLSVFITLLKTWAYKRDFYSKYSFTGHVITLMAIFYLQQEFKLPSLAELQKDTFCYKVGDWNCAFTKIERVNEQLQQLKVVDLLKGFCKFYGDFDYFSFVIAPFFGYPIAKTRFLKTFTLPEVYSAYVQKGSELSVDTGLCVQDLFQLSLNIASSVSYQNIGFFAAVCRFSYKLLGFSKENVLKRFLEDKLVSNQTLCSFSIKQRGPLNEKQWIQCVKLLVYKILINIFSGKIVYAKDCENHVEYRCEGFTDVWRHRIRILKSALKKLNRNASAVDKEIAITSCMNQDRLKKIVWLLSLEITFKKDPARVFVAVKANYESFHLCHFLYTRLDKFLNCEGSRNSCVVIDVDEANVKRKSDESDSNSGLKKHKLTDCDKTESNPPITVISQPGSSQDSTPDLEVDSKVINSSTELTESLTPEINLKFSNGKKFLRILKNQTKVLKSTPTPKFKDQVELLCKNLLKTKEEIVEIKKSLRTSLQTVIKRKFKFDDILFFGSLANGLFTNGSSCDIYVDNLKPIKESDENILESLLNAIKASKLFAENCKIVGEILFCIHVATRIECAISTKSKSFVYSSSLINYYLTRDSKLPNLLFFIKSWIECMKMSVFNSYTITIMVIFYLQQAPYKLPSLAQLQRPCKAVMRENWNVAFTQTKFNDFYIKNGSLKDLLVGFFEFYSNFDYFSYVISPYVGIAIPKTNFLPQIDLPNCFYLYKKHKKYMDLNSSICVQDFFDHSKNVANDVNLVNMGRFACLCRNALQLVHPKSEEQLLYRLLNHGLNGGLVDYRGFELQKEEFFDEQQWIQALVNIVDSILKTIFCCQITKVEEKINNNDGSVVIANKSRTGEITQIVYHCRGNRHIWDNRIIIEKKLNLKNEVTRDINNDIVVSNQIMNDDTRPLITLELLVELTIMSNPTSVRVGVTGSNRFHYIQFLFTRIKSALEKAIIKGEIAKKVDSESWSLAASVIAAPYKILVKGSFNSTSVLSLHEYFMDFDKIIALKVIGDTKMAVEYCFADPKMYLKIIQQQHHFNKEKLNIIPLAPLKKSISNAEFRDWRLTFIHNTTEKDSFSEQIDLLLSQLETIHNADYRKLIENDCNAVLSKVFYKSKIRFLGFDYEYDNLDFYVVSLPQTTTKQAFLQVLKNMLNENEQFENVTIQDEHSLITFKHVRTQVSCFLRVKNKGDSDTYRLLKNYLKLDTKILKLMTLIKFWADFYDLIVVDFFSNTCIYLMVIFYLQQEPYNLSTVKHLQENTKHQTQEEWNYSFMDCTEVTKNLKKAKIEDLFTGFFKFYANFDYISYVISPYFGSGLLKTRFLKPYNLPDGFEEYTRFGKDLHVDSGVCVQDFFEHNQNVASSVSLNSMGVFTTLCRSTLDLMKYGRRLLLYKVMLNCHHSLYEFPAFIIKNNKKMPEEEWIQSVKSRTLKILSEVLYYKLSQIPDFGVNHARYGCVTDHNIWNERVKAWKMISTEIEGVDKEIAISQKVICDFPEDVSWNLHLELVFSKHPSKVKFTYIQKTGCCNIFHICHFFYTRLKFLFDSKHSPYGTKFEMTSTLEENKNVDLDDDSPELVFVEPPVIDLTEDDDILPNNSSKTNLEKLKAEEFEEDDDIPSDFFDDFANEDFLDGLDIVDAWDYDSGGAQTSRDKSLSNEHLAAEKNPMRSKSSSRSTNRSRSRSRRTRSRSKEEPRKRSKAISRSRSRSRRRKRSRSCRRVRSRSISRDRRGRRSKRKRRSSSSTSLGQERVYCRSRSRSPCEFKKKKKSSTYRARKRSASRDSIRSLSPKRTEVKKRKSFLEEITEKLNIIHSGSPVLPTPVPAPVPLPVPPPVGYFFPNPTTFTPLPGIPGIDNITLNAPGIFQDNITSAPTPGPSMSLQTQRSTTNNDQLLELLAQKKISLSEFLTRTAKSEALNNPPSMFNIYKKVKVLSRIQEIIDFMDSSQALNKFKLKPSQTQVFKTEVKYSSPLKKAVVRLHFTTPVKQSSGQHYATALRQILLKAGVLKNLGDNIEGFEDFHKKDIDKADLVKHGVEEAEGFVQSRITSASVSIGVQVDEEDLRSDGSFFGLRKDNRI